MDGRFACPPLHNLRKHVLRVVAVSADFQQNGRGTPRPCGVSFTLYTFPVIILPKLYQADDGLRESGSQPGWMPAEGDNIPENSQAHIPRERMASLESRRRTH